MRLFLSLVYLRSVAILYLLTILTFSVQGNKNRKNKGACLVTIFYNLLIELDTEDGQRHDQAGACGKLESSESGQSWISEYIL